MNNGWVKLHRQLLEWEWYTDINTSRLFIHLVLTVNHKTNNWRGIEIKRGSRLTSLPKLSAETGLSLSKIRTSIKKLKSTDDIADKTHAQHTVLYVNNYDSYQDDSRQDNSPVADQSQTGSRQIASNKNEKKEKNDKNVRIKRKALPELDYPEELNIVAWEEWKLYRKEMKIRAYQPTTRSEGAAIRDLLSMGNSHDEQHQIIQQSMAKGWKGLFGLKNNNASNQNGYSKVTQQNLIEAEKWERSFDQ